MTEVSVEDIQRDPGGYLRRVEAGETLLVLREGHAVAEVKPLTTGGKSPRPFGLCAGEFTTPEDFNAALPDEVLHSFENP